MQLLVQNMAKEDSGAQEQISKTDTLSVAYTRINLCNKPKFIV